MKRKRAMLGIFILFFWSLGCGSRSNPERQTQKESSNLLVFTKTEGYRHASIPDGIAAIKQLDENNDLISITFTEDSTKFNADYLKSFGAVMFLNTTGDVLNEDEQQALEDFIHNGGGFIGVHAAADTEYGWPWYGKMLGAYFKDHPDVQQATLHVLRNDHLATEYLPGNWVRTDEWYNFKDVQEDIIPLISIDETTYDSGENDEESHHPVAWYHEFEGGRVFYTAGGHTKESYSEPLFMRHILGGIKYVLGY